MYFLPYNRSLKEYSRELRSHSTLSEILLWQKLNAKQFRGYTFNRQKPLGNYIVDFFCKKLDLVIEIDGSSHFEDDKIIKDEERQMILEKMGLSFFRVLDNEVKRKMPFVLNSLNEVINLIEDQKGIEKTKFK